LGIETVIYADDSVGFSDTPIDIEALKNSPHLKGTGIEFAEDKCGYVKYAGKELKGLVFLGLELAKDFIRAHSRKGSRLLLSRKELLLGELFYELHDKCQTLSIHEALELFTTTIEEHKVYPEPMDSLAKLFNSKLSGFIISRLQNGE
jgi:hypothetical protein